jgi:hypothetical protein
LSAAAQVRFADALLRTLGGRTVLLHIPAPAVPGDIGEQLGLAQPLFQDMKLGPAVLRKVRPKIATAQTERPAQYELLLSASSVERALGSLAYDSAYVRIVADHLGNRRGSVWKRDAVQARPAVERGGPGLKGRGQC